MIIARISGGLGNQMFQYAAAKSLAEKHQTELGLDLSALEQKSSSAFTAREFELNVFRISGKVLDHQELRSIKSDALLYRLKRRLLNYSYYTEHSLRYQSSFFEQPFNTYLDGYFQSERYFQSIASLIRKEFEFRDLPDNMNSEMLGRINSCESVAVHIRRGDYANNKQIRSIHGLCTTEYYESAINRIKKGRPQATFFFFSDDPSWVKEKLMKRSSDILVDFNTGKSSHEDLRLMMNCSHQIIANSSFSWWGAWLNNNPEKLVIAPSSWFADPKKELEAKDICPSAWIRI